MIGSGEAGGREISLLAIAVTQGDVGLSLDPYSTYGPEAIDYAMCMSIQGIRW